MRKSPTLYVAISAHGYGHIGQTAPVVNELARRHPSLRVVVECGWSRDVLQQRIAVPFEHIQIATDFGMVMLDAFTVDIEESHRRHLESQANLDNAVRSCSERLRGHRVSLVLSNISPVPLLAGKMCGIPTAAFCCLHWADIYHGLCGSMPGAKAVYEGMLSAYQGADVFVAPAPDMPMPTLRNRVTVGPISALGSNRRSALLQLLGLPETEKLVTISMGGIETYLALEELPVLRDVTWIVAGTDRRIRHDIVPESSVPMKHFDLVCSSDVLVTKAGYGAFAEAACNRVPVLYVPRVNWPEEPFLVQWLSEHARCRPISCADLLSERVAGHLHDLWRLPLPDPVVPTGIQEAADVLEPFLRSALPAAAIER